MDAIKDLAFQIKGESNTEEKVFFVAGIKDGEKCALMVMLSEPLVAEGLNAGKLVKEAAKLIQGGVGWGIVIGVVLVPKLKKKD